MSARSDRLVDATVELSVEVSRLPDAGRRRLVDEARQLAATIARKRSLDAEESKSLVGAAEMLGAPFPHEGALFVSEVQSDAEVATTTQDGRIIHAIRRTAVAGSVPDTARLESTLNLTASTSTRDLTLSTYPKGRRTDPDEDVLELVAARDLIGALRLLMQRHGAAVYRYCRDALRDPVLGEDVQQQVFLEVFRDLPKFDSLSTVRTWLFAIARNRVLDAAKPRQRAQSHIDGDDRTNVADPQPSPGDSLDDARLRSALLACLERLTPRVRSALLLRFQQGFSFEDMAAICNEKPGTLQAQVARALPVLRACIEQRIRGGG